MSIFIGIFLGVATYAFGSVGAAVCNAPVAGWFCHARGVDAPIPPPLTRAQIKDQHINQTPTDIPDYHHLVTLQKQFEDIVKPSAGASLSLSVQFSEVALRDLSITVMNSRLPDRLKLSTQLRGFVSDCEAARRSVSQLGSRVGSAVDRFVFHSCSSAT